MTRDNTVKPRLATAEDVPALVRLINLAYRVEDFFVFGDRTTPSEVSARIGTAGAGFLVLDAAQAGELAGAVFVEVQGDRGHFALLSVDPAQQKSGLGRILIGAAEEHCRTAGCRALDMEVVDLRTELPAFYARFGFTATGTAPFPDPGKLRCPAHLVLMTKPLVRHS